MTSSRGRIVRSSPRDDGTPVYLGMRGLGLFLLMFLVVFVSALLRQMP